MVPSSPLQPSSTYLVCLTTAIQGRNGVALQPNTYFALLKAGVPLVDVTTTPATLMSPLLDSSIDVPWLLGRDPAMATQVEWDVAHNLLVQSFLSLEELRGSYGELFGWAQQAGMDRDDLAAMWTFTTQD